MSDWISDILKVVLPGIVIAALTSILTVRLAIRRFHEEKWWEKKEQMYSRLLEILHHLKNFDTVYYETFYSKTLSDNSPRIDIKKFDELYKDWEKFSREFAKLRDLASFLLSNNAVAILDKYEKKKAAHNPDDSEEWIKGDIAAVSECLEELKKAAKRDLKVK